MIIRPARLADSLSVLALRNDPDAVRYSPSGDLVSEAEHAKWYPLACYGSPVFFVASTGGVAVGFARVDILAWVSVALDREYRRRGWARELVQVACAAFPGDVRAQVHQDNAPSLRLFAACGFKELYRDAPWVYFEREREHDRA